MLTAMLGRLAAFPMTTDPTLQERLESFWDRLTCNWRQLLASLIVALVLSIGYLVLTKKTTFLRLLAPLVGFLGFWVTWGAYNRFAVNPKPLFILPLDLDFWFFFDGQNAYWLLLPIAAFAGAFFTVIASNRNKLLRAFIWGLIAAAAVMLVMMLVQDALN